MASWLSRLERAGEVSSTGYAELFIDAAQVVVNGADGQIQARSDLPARMTCCREPCDLMFPGREWCRRAGRAKPWSVRALAERGEVQVATDGAGEVLARSNHVFAGYWERPDESAKVLVDGWFNTGR